MSTEQSTLPVGPQYINIVLDATMLDTYVDCACKFNYRFNLRRSTPELATPLDKGILIHSGLEGYYTGLKDKLSFDISLQQGIESFNVSCTGSDLEQSEITFLRKVLVENITYWRTADQRFEILAVEQPFSYVLYEGLLNDVAVRIIMIGKIDLLVNDDRYNNLPLDTKTYSRDSNVYRKTNQFCNYANATGSNFLIVSRVGLQTSLPPEKKHKRIPLSYDPIFLEQWKMNTIKWCGLYLDSVLNNSWPMNDTSCNKFNRLCEFYPVCDSSGNEAKIYKLNTNFVDAPIWDVSAALGIKPKKETV